MLNKIKGFERTNEAKTYERALIARHQALSGITLENSAPANTYKPGAPKPF